MEHPLMGDARKHIEQIRKDKFWIGVGKNPLRKTLRKAVEYLSAELYSKDVHFLMELIQNAEDNEYPEGIEPSLEFLITSRDITATQAPATLLIFNNEKGFSQKNMESICDVGASTKAGNRKCGYIGEKGIGFKSVFLLTAHPYIFSNGYQIRFSEPPCPECDIAYIVPEWVDNSPSISYIQNIYGRNKSLSTTVLILPLKADKVKAVKEQLSSLHPELLLFLSKIKRLSVKEDNECPAHNTVRAISISSERDFVAKKNIDAESYTVHLTADEEGLHSEGECRYYMWRQRFPVKQQHRVEKRKELEEWPITLAFPFGTRLNRGNSSPGIYAFLPTETFTNLPFIIQADFLLPSSRENILWDNPWNQGILDCVPTAFVNAFVSLIKTSDDAPASSLASMFGFLPINTSSHPKLNDVRELIRKKLLQENILPSESHSTQKIFHKPEDVGRLKRSFWKVLLKAKERGDKLHNLSSQGTHVLHSSFDVGKHNDILKFLNVKQVDEEWYPRCIQSCNLVLGVGEDIYIELLQFLSTEWSSLNDKSTIRNVPLLKYVSPSGDLSLLSVNEAANQYRAAPILCRSKCAQHISWLIEWSKEFGFSEKLFFLPERTQKGCVVVESVLTWLRDDVKVESLSVFQYASLLSNSKSLGSNCKMALAFAHFLHLSFSKGFLSLPELTPLCASMPLVNIHGEVHVRRQGILVPANGSKWLELMGGSNAWGNLGYVILSDVYLQPANYFGHVTREKELIGFLKTHADASDIPDITPPDTDFPTVFGPLTKNNVFLLLEWIRKLRMKGNNIPGKFLNCIQNGSWLRVTMSGSVGCRPPNQSFFSCSSWGTFLQNGSKMVDIPLVDQHFYGSEIRDYKEELKAVGVMFEYSQACKFIGNNLLVLAAQSNLTRGKVMVLLNFIRFLRENLLSTTELVNSINRVKWLKTSCGERAPTEAVLFDSVWKDAKVISDIPFVDQYYYGEDIVSYRDELILLGVTVCFDSKYQIVINHLKPSASFNALMASHFIFALKCLSSSDEKLVSRMQNAKCVWTNQGFKYPKECYLFDPSWGCILQIFDGFPIIDGSFYCNEIFKYTESLRKIGVVVDFDAAAKAVSSKFKQCAKTNSINKENSLAIISSYKTLSAKRCNLTDELRECIHETKWLRTRVGDFRSPKDCILFDEDWHPISGITLLPFVDDSEYFYGKKIHEYKLELKRMGVVTDIKESSRFALSNIFFPRNIDISPESVISLLQCVKNFRQLHSKPLPKDILAVINQTKWLKTTVGYMSPKECMLFDRKHKSSLEKCDGPFIDDEFYGPNIFSYKSELAAIGVSIDMSSKTVTSLIANHVKSLSEFAKIERIYDFLSWTDWKPEVEAQNMIWIPKSADDGFWVPPEECVLHDSDKLFSSRLHVLDQKYNKKHLFGFFSKAFNVKIIPSTVDYCKLWKEWEASRLVISVDECCAFWGRIISYWSKKTEKIVSESVNLIPAVSNDSGNLLLLKKQDVFLPDDLLLKDLFEKSSPYSFFVWCPVRNMPSIPRLELFDVYTKIGVRKISDSVKISEVSVLDYAELKKEDPKNAFIVKGLGMIILSFLSEPVLNVEVKSRHEAVKKLLNVKVYATPEPVKLTYSLQMSSGHHVTATISQMVRWEREKSELFTQQLFRSGGLKNVVEYATKFAEAVSQGLLWEEEDQIHSLSELIKFGFLMDFDEDAVTYFLKSKNMQIFTEDEEFLLSVFPS